MTTVDAPPEQQRSTRPRGPLLVFAIALWIVAAYGAVSMVQAYTAAGHLGLDAHAYWMATRREDVYALGPGYRDAYLYSPAFLQLVSPLALLPWQMFFGAWMLIQTVCFWWLTRPLGVWWQAPVMLLCLAEVLYGNIHGLLGVMLCLALRRPGLWSFAILTKVTLGVVGVVWLISRKDWRGLAEVAGVTVVVVGVSALIDVQAWFDWYHFLTSSQDQEPHMMRVVRLALVIAVVAWAGRTDRPWVLPAAMLAAAPRFSVHIKDLSLLAGTARLAVQSSASRRRTRGATSSP